MESEPQPEPVPLGVVNKMLEKELSIRENRLRCIECGHFQPVPDVEPEPAVEEVTEEEDESTPVGPTCDSCGSQRMTLIEQIQYEHKLALDQQLKDNSALEGMLVIKRGQRLSVQPVEKHHFDEVCRMANIHL